MPAKTIILNIKNNTDFTSRISILGGLVDVNRFNVNAFTQYLWDINLPQGLNPPASFEQSSSFTLQYKLAGALAFETISGNTYGSFIGFVRGLNLLFLGIFNVAMPNTTFTAIVTFNDVYEFGDIVIF